MLERIVQYLHGHDVPFRLFSHPSPEALPAVAVRVPAGGLVVDTHVLLAGGRPAVAVVARGAQLSLATLQSELGVPVFEATTADLPAPFASVSGPVPPLGGLLGALLVVDLAVTRAASVVFAAFSSTDVLEVPFDDFARLERPRAAAFAIGGELPSGAEAPESTRRSA